MCVPRLSLAPALASFVLLQSRCAALVLKPWYGSMLFCVSFDVFHDILCKFHIKVFLSLQ